MNYYVGDKKCNGYKSKVDILPLGTICYAMLFGDYAFNENALLELIKKIECGLYELPINISKEYLSFLTAILQNNINAEELSRHPFLIKNVSEFIKIYPQRVSNYLATVPIFMDIK